MSDRIRYEKLLRLLQVVYENRNEVAPAVLKAAAECVIDLTPLSDADLTKLRVLVGLPAHADEGER
jgi:hypothetical protein